MVRHGITLSGSDRTIQSAIRRTEQYNQTLERERQMLARVTQARARYDHAQQMAGKLRGGGAVAMRPLPLPVMVPVAFLPRL